MDGLDCFLLLVAVVEKLKALRVLQVVAVDSVLAVLDSLVEHLSPAFVDVPDVTVVLIGLGTDKMHQTNCSILIWVLAIEVVIQAEH